ncbi:MULTISPECIES: undecaprenyl-diphosphatase [Paenibacillus]|uniref:Undecaprenyl-diphosphatase n=1 Tax=Paenibacillus pabuli TaxID=1472 RepID=A0A855XLK1_9BACL|nr:MULTISPECIES: undecaprenyl-diphosphatase [Paenibacillus]PWW33966.1 undecaprenyl-diphosphatase [Paenibacillus pabuli]PXW00612.1 undecaprenyl-diphosphatase [Paenibacillus taichungensis]RAJ02931.1 undecaprenyl-diphosphatase [Paenibacillus pabuli]
MSFIRLDYQLFHWINQQAMQLSYLDGIMIFFAKYALFMFPAGMFVYWISKSPQNRMIVLQAILAACAGTAISFVTGHLLHRDRPFVTHSVIQLISHSADASFPSDHATVAFACAAAFWLGRVRYRWGWVLIAAFIMIARVWSGVHYPSDVAAGALIGMASAWGIGRIFIRMKLPALFIPQQARTLHSEDSK